MCFVVYFEMWNESIKLLSLEIKDPIHILVHVCFLPEAKCHLNANCGGFGCKSNIYVDFF